MIFQLHGIERLMDLGELVRVQLEKVRLEEQLLTRVLDLLDVILGEDQLLIARGELLQCRGQMIVGMGILHDRFHQASERVDGRLRLRADVHFGIFVGERDRWTGHGSRHRSLVVQDRK